MAALVIQIALKAEKKACIVARATLPLTCLSAPIEAFATKLLSIRRLTLKLNTNANITRTPSTRHRKQAACLIAGSGIESS